MLNFLHPCRIFKIHSCVDKPFSYFYKDVWFEYGLKESRQFPMFENGPYWLFTFLVVFLAFLHLLLEPFMKSHSKRLDSRPLLLVFNSVLFTVNFVGFLVLFFFITDFGLDLWTCTFKVDIGDQELILKMGYVYILIKLFELLRPVLFVLRGHKPHKIDTFGQVLFIMLVYIGFTFYPFGVFTWTLFIDLFYHIFVYVYLIFSCIGEEAMRPTKYKNHLSILNMLKFACCSSHAYVTFPEECKGYYFLKIISVTHSLVGFMFATVYMIDKLDEETEKRKKLKKAD